MKLQNNYLSAGWAVALLSLILIVPGSRTAAQAQEARESEPILIPGGVVDPNGQTAYLANTLHKGISAVDLATGKVLWQAQGPIRPILVTGQKLIAWRPVEYAHNGLRVWALDTRTGRTTWSSALVVLPPSVFVDSDSAVKPPFFLTGRIQNGLLELIWSVPAPSTGATHNAGSHVGIACVDLQTGSMANPPHHIVLTRPDGWVSKAVVGPRAYYLVEEKGRGGEAEEERIVRAVDRQSGKTLWEFPLGAP